MFDLNDFISQYVILREKRMFLEDIKSNREQLSKRI